MIAASDNAGIKETQLPRFLSFLFPPRDVISWSPLSSGLACLLALPNARSCSLSHSPCYRMLRFDCSCFHVCLWCDSFLSGVHFLFPHFYSLIFISSFVSFPSLFVFSHNFRCCFVLPRCPSVSTCSTFPLSCTVLLSDVTNRPLGWDCWIPDFTSRWNIACKVSLSCRCRFRHRLTSVL